MILTTTHLIIALAALNALALLALLAAGRERKGRAERRQRRRKETAVETKAAERPEPVLPAEDPLHALVNEIEREESALHGRVTSEERLAADMARWRKRASGGQPLPGPAASCRAGGGVSSTAHVA
jgi:hypothetical protein